MPAVKMKKRTHGETHTLVSSIMEEMVPDPEEALKSFMTTGHLPPTESPARRFESESGLDLGSLEGEAAGFLLTATSVHKMLGTPLDEALRMAMMSAIQLGWELHKRCLFDYEQNPPE